MYVHTWYISAIYLNKYLFIQNKHLSIYHTLLILQTSIVTKLILLVGFAFVLLYIILEPWIKTLSYFFFIYGSRILSVEIKKIYEQGDHDDAREITAVWCWNDKKTKFRGDHLGFLTGISQSILTKLCTRI